MGAADRLGRGVDVLVVAGLMRDCSGIVVRREGPTSVRVAIDLPPLIATLPVDHVVAL